MSTLFALVISVCALTGECSDVLIGVYDTEKSALTLLQSSKLMANACPTSRRSPQLTTNSLQ